jgi:hypothetical protein
MDALSNPLLKERNDEALLRLSTQGIKELQEWECPTLSCPEATRQLTRFDRKGRVIETHGRGVLVRYDYEGEDRYPSRVTTLATTDDVRPKGTVLAESGDRYTPQGLRIGDATWTSNAKVAVWSDVGTGQSQMYLHGRLFTALEMSLGQEGFPLGVIVEKDCKVQTESHGVTYVTTYLKAPDEPQRLANEARFNANGDWIWNRSHRPNGGIFEQAFTVLASDSRSNWTVRRNRTSHGTSYVQFRKIAYWADEEENAGQAPRN